jgi:UDP-3-O-[3-hydroxymyristoyl] glucosamine N-acyltransferase
MRPLDLIGISSWDDASENKISWVNKTIKDQQDVVECLPSKVIVCGKDVIYSKSMAIDGKILLVSEHPRLLIIHISQLFQTAFTPAIDDSAHVNTDANIGAGCYIGKNCIIGKCIIGENTYISDNVVIYDDVVIGSGCKINASSIIGCECSGIERDLDYSMITFPHTSNVIIEDNVTIGVRTTIVRGVLTPTKIGRGSTIDSHCLIGHNTHISSNVYISSGTCVSGSVKIGEGVNIFTRSVIGEWISIGKYSVIGMASMVNKDIPEFEMWYGHPARFVKKLHEKYIPFE